MIQIQVSLYSNGCLKSLKAEGHALTFKAEEKRENLPCGIISAVLKTGSKLLYIDDKIEAEGDAPSAGKLYIKVKSIKKERELWVKGVTDMLMSSLAEVKSVYPDAVSIDIKIENNQED
ncbi:MAG: ribosomal-processing cysteine protease Prp [Spirochaetales bacterium]|nr:ribosomal-processing cysteine protease Prp [Spirochaetales bacterium]